jgi:O-antigen/teichoic acid export membrane protein
VKDTDVVTIPGDPVSASSLQVRVSALLGALSWSKIKQIGYSLTDQVLGVGGMFLANIVLARVQSKEEYGMFALSYSVYTFLTAVHNALILEPYSIHGPGRYHDRFSAYARIMSRGNALLGGGLTVILLSVWVVLRWRAPGIASRSLLGLALTIAVFLTALFVRRTFYIRRRPDLAARFSVIFFVCLVALLGLSTRFGLLSGFSTFAMAAFSWIVAGVFLAMELPGLRRANAFHESTPDHWSEHWKYARWVLATAFIFQLTNQGYYWLVAGLISVKEVAELKAMYLLVGPVDQIFIALDLLVLPLMAFRYASKQHSDLVSLWKGFAALNCFIGICYVAFIWIFGRRFMHSVYAGKFDDISALLSILAVLPVVAGIGNTFNVALKSMERPDLVFRAYVASGLVTIILGTPLVLHFGLRGAVYGILTSAGVYSVAMGTGLVMTATSRLGGASYPAGPGGPL